MNKYRKVAIDCRVWESGCFCNTTGVTYATPVEGCFFSILPYASV